MALIGYNAEVRPSRNLKDAQQERLRLAKLSNGQSKSLELWTDNNKILKSIQLDLNKTLTGISNTNRQFGSKLVGSIIKTTEESKKDLGLRLKSLIDRSSKSLSLASKMVEVLESQLEVDKDRKINDKYYQKELINQLKTLNKNILDLSVGSDGRPKHGGNLWGLAGKMGGRMLSSFMYDQPVNIPSLYRKNPLARPGLGQHWESFKERSSKSSRATALWYADFKEKHPNIDRAASVAKSGLYGAGMVAAVGAATMAPPIKLLYGMAEQYLFEPLGDMLIESTGTFIKNYILKGGLILKPLKLLGSALSAITSGVGSTGSSLGLTPGKLLKMAMGVKGLFSAMDALIAFKDSDFLRQIEMSGGKINFSDRIFSAVGKFFDTFTFGLSDKLSKKFGSESTSHLIKKLVGSDSEGKSSGILGMFGSVVRTIDKEVDRFNNAENKMDYFVDLASRMKKWTGEQVDELSNYLLDTIANVISPDRAKKTEDIWKNGTFFDKVKDTGGLMLDFTIKGVKWAYKYIKTNYLTKENMKALKDESISFIKSLFGATTSNSVVAVEEFSWTSMIVGWMGNLGESVGNAIVNLGLSIGETIGEIAASVKQWIIDQIPDSLKPALSGFMSGGIVGAGTAIGKQVYNSFTGKKSEPTIDAVSGRRTTPIPKRKPTNIAIPAHLKAFAKDPELAAKTLFELEAQSEELSKHLGTQDPSSFRAWEWNKKEAYNKNKTKLEDIQSQIIAIQELYTGKPDVPLAMVPWFGRNKDKTSNAINMYKDDASNLISSIKNKLSSTDINSMNYNYKPFEESKNKFINSSRIAQNWIDSTIKKADSSFSSIELAYLDLLVFVNSGGSRRKYLELSETERKQLISSNNNLNIEELYNKAKSIASDFGSKNLNTIINSTNQAISTTKNKTSSIFDDSMQFTKDLFRAFSGEKVDLNKYAKIFSNTPDIATPKATEVYKSETGATVSPAQTKVEKSIEKQVNKMPAVAANNSSSVLQNIPIALGGNGSFLVTFPIA